MANNVQLDWTRIPLGVAWNERLPRYAQVSLHAEGKRVLDVGCGAGFGAFYLARAGALEVVALDSRPSMVAEARERFADVERLSFECRELVEWKNLGERLARVRDGRAGGGASRASVEETTEPGEAQVAGIDAARDRVDAAETFDLVLALDANLPINDAHFVNSLCEHVADGGVLVVYIRPADLCFADVQQRLSANERSWKSGLGGTPGEEESTYSWEAHLSEHFEHRAEVSERRILHTRFERTGARGFEAHRQESEDSSYVHLGESVEGRGRLVWLSNSPIPRLEDLECDVGLSDLLFELNASAEQLHRAYYGLDRQMLVLEEQLTQKDGLVDDLEFEVQRSKSDARELDQRVLRLNEELDRLQAELSEGPVFLGVEEPHASEPDEEAVQFIPERAMPQVDQDAHLRGAIQQRDATIERLQERIEHFQRYAQDLRDTMEVQRSTIEALSNRLRWTSGRDVESDEATSSVDARTESPPNDPEIAKIGVTRPLMLSAEALLERALADLERSVRSARRYEERAALSERSALQLRDENYRIKIDATRKQAVIDEVFGDLKSGELLFEELRSESQRMLVDSQTHSQELERELETVRGELEQNHQQYLQRTQEIEQQLGDSGRQCTELQSELNELGRTHRALQAESTHAQGVIAGLHSSIDTLQAEHATTRSSLTASRQLADALDSERKELIRSLEELRQRDEGEADVSLASESLNKELEEGEEVITAELPEVEDGVEEEVRSAADVEELQEADSAPSEEDLPDDAGQQNHDGVEDAFEGSGSQDSPHVVTSAQGDGAEASEGVLELDAEDPSSSSSALVEEGSVAAPDAPEGGSDVGDDALDKSLDSSDEQRAIDEGEGSHGHELESVADAGDHDERDSDRGREYVEDSPDEDQSDSHAVVVHSPGRDADDADDDELDADDDDDLVSQDEFEEDSDDSSDDSGRFIESSDDREVVDADDADDGYEDSDGYEDEHEPDDHDLGSEGESAATGWAVAESVAKVAESEEDEVDDSSEEFSSEESSSSALVEEGSVAAPDAPEGGSDVGDDALDRSLDSSDEQRAIDEGEGSHGHELESVADAGDHDERDSDRGREYVEDSPDEDQSDSHAVVVHSPGRDADDADDDELDADDDDDLVSQDEFEEDSDDSSDDSGRFIESSDDREVVDADDADDDYEDDDYEDSIDGEEDDDYEDSIDGEEEEEEGQPEAGSSVDEEIDVDIDFAQGEVSPTGWAIHQGSDTVSSGAKPVAPAKKDGEG